MVAIPFFIATCNLKHMKYIIQVKEAKVSTFLVTSRVNKPSSINYKYFFANVKQEDGIWDFLIETRKDTNNS